MQENENHLVRIFRDASAHKEVARIISRHNTSKEDIREVALDGIDLSKAKKILDLGCGFGFFTEGLKNKVGSDAEVTGLDCHPEYEWFYFQSCERVNIKKRFLSKGSKAIKQMEDQKYDVILCSYALYFFPEMISEISRILKKDGKLIVITHSTPHFHQFAEFVNEILIKNGVTPQDETPYEHLIEKFSNKNGEALLSPFFGRILQKGYKSNLVFKNGDFEDFASYFNFKHSFFIPRAMDPTGRLHALVLDMVKQNLEKGNELHIGKDDMIFICLDPLDHYK